MDDFVEFIKEEMGQLIGSRHEAADILRTVAEYGQAGLFPSDVTCEQLGRALRRICVNAGDEDPLTSIIKGYRAAEREYEKRLRCHPDTCEAHRLAYPDYHRRRNSR